MGHATAPARELDERAALLANRLQRHIPLVERPFQVLAGELKMDEGEVLDRLRELRRSRLVRQTSAIFEAGALGYRSSLVAARYDPEELDAGAEVISAYPGVSHNYRRNHDFNLWYTVAVPPGVSLEATVAALGRLSGARSSLALPTLRRFKLGVRLAVGDEAPIPAADDDPPPAHGGLQAPLSDSEKRAVRALQEDIEICERPFDGPAGREGFASAAELLGVGEALRARGAMRRFAAILRHREAGYRANGMAVWRVAEERCEEAGAMMASFPEVSHCYQRPVCEGWPYSLFTMIHGQDEDQVEGCVRRIAAAAGLADYQVLYSSTEYKKRRVRYFTDEWEAWERRAGATR
jgi:DNA-binding Lrp family transcriptional regulator